MRKREKSTPRQGAENTINFFPDSLVIAATIGPSKALASYRNFNKCTLLNKFNEDIGTRERERELLSLSQANKPG